MCHHASLTGDIGESLLLTMLEDSVLLRHSLSLEPIRVARLGSPQFDYLSFAKPE